MPTNGLPNLPPDHGQLPFDDRAAEKAKRRRGRWILLVAFGSVLLGGAVAFFFVSRTEMPVQVPPEAVPPEPHAQVDAPDGPPVSTAEADATARTSLATLSAEPEWKEWLSEQDLLRRGVAAVTALDAGESARNALPFLAPKTPFAVLEREDGRMVIDPATWTRSEALGRVLSALSVEEVARAYAEVRPLLRQFYREGAPPGARFEAALDRVLARILAVPLPEADAELVPEGAGYAYADPVLEARPAADKQLMRLGPETLGILQEKARALRSALRH